MKGGLIINQVSHFSPDTRFTSIPPSTPEGNCNPWQIGSEILLLIQKRGVMNFLKTIKPFFKKISLFYLFLMAASPILISFLIHMGILIYASFAIWSWSDERPVIEEPISGSLLLEDKSKAGLEFQETDFEDNFDEKDNKAEPVPEVENEPDVPDEEIPPEPVTEEATDNKTDAGLEVISVQAAAIDGKWVSTARGGQAMGIGSEMMAGSFSRHIQSMREGGLDVVFVFDSTASMSGYLNEVKRKIKNLAAAFRKLVPACRIGLVTYRDKRDEYVTKLFPLTYGVVNLQDFLNGINYGGGYDVREAVTEGLEAAIEKMKWNDKSKKFILLIGDAPPHLEDMVRTISLVKTFREKMGGKLCALDIRQPQKITKYYWTTVVLPNMKDPGIESFEYLTDSEKVMDDFQTLVDAGGGECARLTEEEKVIKHMLLLVFGTRWETYLEEFMQNL
jgi:Mg-chelatase subunit ChlD